MMDNFKTVSNSTKLEDITKMNIDKVAQSKE